MIALNGEYLISGEIYDFMVNGKGKCYGYSEVYSYLLAQVGVNSEIVESEALFYQWNKVEIDGVYYQVDVTWDDPTPDSPGFVDHTFFLLSDAAIEGYEANPHYDYTTDFPSTDTRYDNMRYHKINTQMCYAGNDCYVVDNNHPSSSDTAKNLLIYSFDEDSFETVQSFQSEYWSAGNGYVWGKMFMSLQEHDDYLYMNTENTVYVYDTRTGELSAFAQNTFDQSFYGLRVIGGKVYAVLADNPNVTGTLQYIGECLLHKAEPTTEGPTTVEPTTEEPTTVEPVIEPVVFAPEHVVVVGNGEKTWLNGAAWNPDYRANEMDKVAEGVYEISFENVPEGCGRELQFAVDGTWEHHFGGTFTESGVVSEAIYNGGNISFDTEDLCTVKLQLDLRDFDFATKTGARFTVTIDDTPAPLLGDLDGDGLVSVEDATVIQRALAEFIVLTDAQREVADVNRDGRINIRDVLQIQRYAAEIIRSFD